MKKIIIGLGLLCACTGVFARDIPRAVRDQFKRDYPDVTVMHWEMSHDRWNASFENNGATTTACYDMRGHHIDSRMPISQAIVPDEVIHHLRDNYPGERAYSFTKIDRPHKRDLYKVNLTHRGSAKTIYMDRKGHEEYYASR